MADPTSGRAKPRQRTGHPGECGSNSRTGPRLASGGLAWQYGCGCGCGAGRNGAALRQSARYPRSARYQEPPRSDSTWSVSDEPRERARSTRSPLSTLKEYRENTESIQSRENTRDYAQNTVEYRCILREHERVHPARVANPERIRRDHDRPRENTTEHERIRCVGPRELLDRDDQGKTPCERPLRATAAH